MKRLSTPVRLLVAALGAAGALCLPSVSPVAQADQLTVDPLGYLIGVTVRPGYNFANADQALAYGFGICDKITTGRPYAQLVADIKTDLNTGDELQVSYLVSKATEELCPAQIWALRNSAAGYVAAPT